MNLACQFCVSPVTKPCAAIFSSTAVSGEEVFRTKRPEIRQCVAQSAVFPVPPGEPVHALADLFREALADEFGRHAADDRIGSDVLGDDGTSADDGAVADGHARQDRCAMADPDIVADYDAVRAAPFE